MKNAFHAVDELFFPKYVLLLVKKKSFSLSWLPEKKLFKVCKPHK